MLGMPCNTLGMPSVSSSRPGTASPGPSFREASWGYQVNHLARLFEAALRGRVAPHGVAPGQFAQLLALYERDGVSQSELCDAVQIDQSTMAHTLRRMERDDLVVRVPSEHDGRRNDIRLTARARQLKPTLIECAGDINTAASAGIDEGDLAVAHRVIAQMIQNLETGNEEARP